MIDLTKKWKTRNGWPVKNLIETPDGMIEGDLHRPDMAAPDRFRWYADGTVSAIDPEDPLDLVPDEDEPAAPRFPRGCRVRKKSGSWWEGIVVGHYSTRQTPDGICVQLEKPNGPVQIYPASAMEAVE